MSPFTKRGQHSMGASRLPSSGSPLCQDMAAATGVRSVVSPGSGLSEVLAMGIRSAALDVSVAP